MIHVFSGQPTTHATRDLEWVAALLMMSLSLVLMVPGDTLKAPQFAAFHIYGVGESFWTGVFGIIGGSRMIVLHINGRSPRTPLLRTLGALVGLILWVNLSYLLHIASREAFDAETLGEGPFMVFALIEAISVYRASYDARYQRGRK